QPPTSSTSASAGRSLRIRSVAAGSMRAETLVSRRRAIRRWVDMRVIPLPAPLEDDPGAVRVVADEPHSYPCRRCLRDADVGDTMLLLGYDPFLGSSPYAGRGPIYVHERECAPFASDDIPAQLTRRLLSVRAYDERHMLVDADVTEGLELAD